MHLESLNVIDYNKLYYYANEKFKFSILIIYKIRVHKYTTYIFTFSICIVFIRGIKKNFYTNI